MKKIWEYIWLDEDFKFRSKTRIADTCDPWSYDGSSTGQANTRDSEIILVPVEKYPCPFGGDYLVLCETYNVDGTPTNTNTRKGACDIFDTDMSLPWFGMEQELFLGTPRDEGGSKHYCGVGYHIRYRDIMEIFVDNCMAAGLSICGVNAEVAQNQWEYQIGPCEGIEMADQLTVSRYIMQRTCEAEGVPVTFEPKPLSTANGSGCHTNFSTKETRIDGGMKEILRIVEKLTSSHAFLMERYGTGNEERMTGSHETAHYDTFSWGVGSRNTSIRIPKQVEKDGKGYLEDRRPASNCDPYVVTSSLLKCSY